MFSLISPHTIPPSFGIQLLIDASISFILFLHYLDIQMLSSASQRPFPFFFLTTTHTQVGSAEGGVHAAFVNIERLFPISWCMF